MDGKLFIHGGFEPSKPTIATGNLYKVDLTNTLGSIPALQSMLQQGQNEQMDEEQIQKNIGENWRLYDLAPQAIISMP